MMAVLGDSFRAHIPGSDGPEWPEILGNSLERRVFANTVDASGYVNPGAGRPFGPRVESLLRRDPDVVVIAGGASDLGGSRSRGCPAPPPTSSRGSSRQSRRRK